MRKHEVFAAGIQWLEFEYGLETWVLWRCKCGCRKRRIEKIEGHWSRQQLGYASSSEASDAS